MKQKSELNDHNKIIMQTLENLKQEYRKFKILSAFMQGILATLILIFCLVLCKKFFYPNLNRSYFFLALSCPVLALFINLIQPCNLEILIPEADRRLGLKEMLSTVYQYLKKEPENPFLPFLQTTLAEQLEFLPLKQVFPLKNSLLMNITLVSFLLLILVLLPGRTLLFFTTPSSPRLELGQVNQTGDDETPTNNQFFPQISGKNQNRNLEKPEDISSRPQQDPGINHFYASEQEKLEQRLSEHSEVRDFRHEQKGEKSPFPDNLHESGSAPGEQEEKERPTRVASEEGVNPDSPGELPGEEIQDSKKETTQKDKDSRQQLNPEDDDDSHPRGSYGDHSSVKPEEEKTSPESAGYKPTGIDSLQVNDSYLSTYLEELFPPEPGVQNNDFYQRLLKYNTHLIPGMISEEIPIFHRELIKEYFSQ